MALTENLTQELRLESVRASSDIPLGNSLERGSTSVDSSPFIKASTSRELQLDFLKSISIVCVVVIHSVHGAVTPAERFLATLVDTLTRPCIAIFLFVAGYLFHSAAIVDRLKKTIVRIVLPYSVFFALALIYEKKGGTLDYILGEPLKVVFRFVTGSITIYYFPFVILTASVCVAAILLLRVGATGVWILTAALLAVNLLHAAYLDDFARSLGPQAERLELFYIYRSPAWLFYFVLGMAARMHRWPLETVSSAKWLSRVPFFLTVSAYVGLILLVPEETAGVMAYNSVIGTCYSVSAILFLASFRVEARGWSFLAERTYFLYLSHILVVNSLRDLAAQSGIAVPFWFSCVTLIVAIAVPLSVLALLKPLLRDRSRLLIGA